MQVKNKDWLKKNRQAFIHSCCVKTDWLWPVVGHFFWKISYRWISYEDENQIFSHESNKGRTYPNCNFVNSVGWVLLRFLKAKTKLFQFYTNNSLWSWYIQDYSKMVLAYDLGQDSRLPEPTLDYFQALNVSTHLDH